MTSHHIFRESILHCADERGFHVDVDDHDRHGIRQRLNEKFQVDFEYFVGQINGPAQCLCCRTPTMALNLILPDAPAALMFLLDREVSLFWFPSARLIPFVMWDAIYLCHSFIADLEASYLISIDADAGGICGAGVAEPWIENLKQRQKNGELLYP